MTGSEQCTWAAAHVKLEMTHDNERLMKFQAPNTYRGGPVYSMATPVSRENEIEGAEIQ